MGRQVAMLGRLWGDRVRWSLRITSIHFNKYFGVSCQRPEGGTEEVEVFAEGEGKKAVERGQVNRLTIGFGVSDGTGGVPG